MKKNLMIAFMFSLCLCIPRPSRAKSFLVIPKGSEKNISYGVRENKCAHLKPPNLKNLKHEKQAFLIPIAEEKELFIRYNLFNVDEKCTVILRFNVNKNKAYAVHSNIKKVDEHTRECRLWVTSKALDVKGAKWTSQPIKQARKSAFSPNKVCATGE